ncbi:MAG: type II toxin-antitoxin system prevent-host-death family antitoxin [Nitrospirae bacterium]|jgi:prevent-host-death family protein|nr:type II toxin-antitoxin system prevent-host-death family antitoxin [Nitrospirota bacterium]MDA8059819.1 type II toxin-antitoxin system prevent-host-death family antitoxin [Nitrospiraceae bacterium]
MMTVNVTELRQHLPAYLKQAAAGEEILIASHGKIIARLLPEEDPSRKAKNWLESLRGKVLLGDVVSPVEDTGWSADENHL